MDALIYDILLLSMMFVLYKAGISLQQNGKILSPAGFSAIIVYTLNEGLRFGRGIDYNLYGMAYNYLETENDVRWDYGFLAIAKTLIGLGIPWQGYVMLMSCVFIVATIILLKVYKEVLPFALPFFIFYSIDITENVMRWCMAFSFIMIGLAILLNDTSSQKHIKFFLFSAFACTIHLAIAPIPIIFYLLTYRKSPILSPLYVIALYFFIAFTFQTDFMLRFVDIANRLSMISERFEGYGNRAEYWLTGGFAGTTMHTSLPSILEIIFYCTTVILGYTAVKNAERRYIYAYNLFVIGLLINPIGLQIELVLRYDKIFLFFQAIVLACIIDNVLVKKNVKIGNIVIALFLISFLNTGRRALTAPFQTPDYYLYVWNDHNYTYESIYQKRIFDLQKEDTKKRRRKINVYTDNE